MNFLEALEELDVLNEAPGKGSNGGQKTYKDFLIFLAQFLGINIPSNYKANWVLHHLDCDHFNNSEFENLVLMNPVHHISFHKQLHDGASLDDMKALLVNGQMKHGTKDKFEYWLIGEEIAARINKVQTERDMT